MNASSAEDDNVHVRSGNEAENAFDSIEASEATEVQGDSVSGAGYIDSEVVHESATEIEVSLQGADNTAVREHLPETQRILVPVR